MPAWVRSSTTSPARGVATEDVTSEVEHVWWASLAQEITVRDPAYGTHDGAGLRRDVAEFAGGRPGAPVVDGRARAGAPSPAPFVKFSPTTRPTRR